MDILTSLQKLLDAASWAEVEQIADATGVPYYTLAKIKRGETTDPRLSTVEPILAYIRQREAA